jgi:hypothetical protein
LGEKPVDRDGDAFGLALVWVLKQDHAAVGFCVVDLHDACAGGFVGKVEDDDRLSGGKYHARKIEISAGKR